MKKIFLLNIFLVKILFLSAQAPAIQWEKSLGGSGNEFANSTKPTSDGGYITTGYTSSNDSDVTGNHGGNDFWLVKLNAQGILQWQKCYGGSNDESPEWVEQTSDHGYIVAGYSESTDGDVTGHHGGADTSDCWIIKTDSIGTLQWENCYGGPWYDAGMEIHRTNDGGFILCGQSMNTGGDVSSCNGSYDFWVVKLDNPNSVETLAAENEIRVYPNPFGQFTTISFNNPENEVLQLLLYNANGQLLMSTKTNSGQFHPDMENYQNGIYFFVILKNNQIFGKGKLVNE